MKRLLLGCTVLLALLAVGSLVLIQHDKGSGSPADIGQLSATATFSSRSVLFGDTVEARLDLTLPRRLAGIKFQGDPNFKPFQIVSRHVERADLGGGLERVSVRYGLACLSRYCVSSGPSMTLRFRPTAISIPDNGGTLSAAWPPLVEISRAQNVSRPVADGLDSTAAGFAGLQPRRDTDEALGAALGSLVLLLAGWFFVRVRVRRRLAAAARAGSLLQALLARVEAGLPEDVIYQQRHALDALAVELRHRHINGTLALRAERLAWAPEHPDPLEIRALCTEIRQMVKA